MRMRAELTIFGYAVGRGTILRARKSTCPNGQVERRKGKDGKSYPITKMVVIQPSTLQHPGNGIRRIRLAAAGEMPAPG
jgi:hypothetical protein